MMYLKKYKQIFESSSELDDIVNNCKDILIDISDSKEFHNDLKILYDPVKIQSREVGNYAKYITIGLYKIDKLPMIDYIDDIMRVNDYLGRDGFDLKSIYSKPSMDKSTSIYDLHYQNNFKIVVSEILNDLNFKFINLEYIKYNK